MKRSRLLNSELSYEIAKIGHTAHITLCDAGLPIPNGVKRIDLAVEAGLPSFNAAMILVLAAVTCAIGKWSTKPDDMLMEMGIDMQQFSTGNEVLVWLILPMLCACTIAVVQLTISIFAGAIAGYIVSIVYLVVSVYWVSPFLMGNYLMIIRNNRLCAGGMDAAAGIISCIIVMVVSVVLGSVYFNKKNIL